MYTIDIEKRCSCVKKDTDLTLPLAFDSREKAELEALKREPIPKIPMGGNGSDFVPYRGASTKA